MNPRIPLGDEYARQADHITASTGANVPVCEPREITLEIGDLRIEYKRTIGEDLSPQTLLESLLCEVRDLVDDLEAMG